MCQNRLNNVFLLHAHKGLTDELDTKQIAINLIRKMIVDFSSLDSSLSLIPSSAVAYMCKSSLVFTNVGYNNNAETTEKMTYMIVLGQLTY